MLRGLGDGRFAHHGGFNPSAGGRVQSLAVADFDGNADVAAVSLSRLSVRLGAGNGTFAGGPDLPFSNPYPAFVAAGDFDGNGKQTSRSRSTAVRARSASCPARATGRSRAASVPQYVRELPSPTTL